MRASAAVPPRRSLADDDQERRGRLLLLGEGAVLAHRLARPLAAESDESEQRPTRGARTCWLLLHGCGRLRDYAAHARPGRHSGAATYGAAALAFSGRAGVGDTSARGPARRSARCPPPLARTPAILGQARARAGARHAVTAAARARSRHGCRAGRLAARSARHSRIVIPSGMSVCMYRKSHEPSEAVIRWPRSRTGGAARRAGAVKSSPRGS